MSEHEFDLRLKQINERYEARKEGAEAERDQEMARLFNECEWSQEKIAHHLGKKQPWVARRLKFGQFLSFMPTGNNSDIRLTNLTERRFRDYWKRTKGTDKERFAEVLRILRDGIPQGMGAIQAKPGVRDAVAEVLEDGRPRTVRQIVAAVEGSLPGVTCEQIQNAIRGVKSSPPAGRQMAIKSIGNKKQYRLVKAKNQAKSKATDSPVENLYEKVLPLIEELEEIGRMHEARMSPVAVRMIAAKLRRLFDTVHVTVTA